MRVSPVCACAHVVLEAAEPHLDHVTHERRLSRLAVHLQSLDAGHVVAIAGQQQHTVAFLHTTALHLAAHRQPECLPLAWRPRGSLSAIARRCLEAPLSAACCMPAARMRTCTSTGASTGTSTGTSTRGGAGRGQCLAAVHVIHHHAQRCARVLTPHTPRRQRVQRVQQRWAVVPAVPGGSFKALATLIACAVRRQGRRRGLPLGERAVRRAAGNILAVQARARHEGDALGDELALCARAVLDLQSQHTGHTTQGLLPAPQQDSGRCQQE